MGIFDKKSNKIHSEKPTTENFYFGAIEAEGENVLGSSLLDYFDDYLNILGQLEVGKFIFTGRKGVGKSAIAKFIKDSSDDTYDSFAKILRITDFDTEKSIQISDQNINKEKLIYEWLILVNMVKLIVSNEYDQYSVEYKKLKKFIDINSGIVNIDSYEFNGGEKNYGGEANFAVLKHSFGGVFKNYFKSNVNKAPFYKLIPALKDILKIILNYPKNKSFEYWILFDDLDVNFNIKLSEDNFKVMELIRISKEYNNEIFKNNKAKILIFLRDDMRDNLLTKYADSAKIFSTYEILINWYTDIAAMRSEEDLSLKKLADKRIEINFKNKGIPFSGSPWNALFKEEFPNKSSFKYVLDFTFYRPRDIITFLSRLSDKKFEYPINKRNLKILLGEYINININEIKSELKLFFTEYEVNIIFNSLFPYVSGNQYLSKKDLLNKINEFDFNMDAEIVIELLSKYSLIILRDNNNNLFFSYRDNIELQGVDSSNLYYTLPKCIYHKYRPIN